MKVGTKLNLAFIIIIVFMLISSIYAYLNFNFIEEKFDKALNDRVVQVKLVDEIRVNLAMQGLYARAVIIEPSSSNKENLDSYAEKLDQNLVDLSKLFSSEQMTTYYNSMTVHNDNFNKSIEDLIVAIEREDLNQATSIVTGNLQDANAGILNDANLMIEYQNEQLDLIRKDTASAIATAETILIIMFVLSFLVGIFTMILIRRVITIPLTKVMVGATAISNSDLTQEDLNLKSKDEIGDLGRIFDEMKHNLHSLIGNIQGNSEQLSAAAEQLSASSEQISATTVDMTHQVATAADVANISMRAASESATAMDETAQGVQRIAEASQELHGASLDASAQATDGKQTLEKANTQMHVINKTTISVNDLVQKLAKQIAEIENITRAITDITEQTNLLALNASIEAARAGEHGKGFAVVADEVKKLAEQSKDSANSIALLTSEIQGDTVAVERAVSDAIASVKDGVEIITIASDTFDQIMSSVNSMTNQIQEVSATAEQLSASAEEVSASIAEIATGSGVSADNINSISAAMEEQTATMQEVSGVAVSLADSAQELQQEIQKFRV